MMAVYFVDVCLFVFLTEVPHKCVSTGSARKLCQSPLIHSVPSCKKQSYKKLLVDMATGKKRQLVEIDMVKKRVSYSK